MAKLILYTVAPQNTCVVSLLVVFGVLHVVTLVWPWPHFRRAAWPWQSGQLSGRDRERHGCCYGIVGFLPANLELNSSLWGSHDMRCRARFDIKSVFPHILQCCYNMVNFLKNPHERHPLECPLWQAMGCFCDFKLWILYCPGYCSDMYNIGLCLMASDYRGIPILKMRWSWDCYILKLESPYW